MDITDTTSATNTPSTTTTTTTSIRPTKPTQPESGERQQRIRIKNRRRRFLALHPEYFDAPHHELADPLLYDRLIRHFHTSTTPTTTAAAANEHENPLEIQPNSSLHGSTNPRKSTTSQLHPFQQPSSSTSGDLLEAHLLRSEAKLSALRANPPEDPHASIAYIRAADGVGITGVEKDTSERAVDAEDGRRRWQDFLTERFLRGEDGEFEYFENVDGNDEFDDWEEEGRVKLEEWLDEEEPVFLVREEDGVLGETGVQDF